VHLIETIISINPKGKITHKHAFGWM